MPCDPIPSSKRDWRIYLCQPSYGKAEYESVRAFLIGHAKPGGITEGRCEVASLSRSLLANCFNNMWVQALNLRESGEPVKYFAMLHGDIVPEEGWLDVLLEDLLASDADLMAAVVPLKDTRGLTSTAIEDPAEEFGVLRRLSMQELWNPKLPDVFGSADLGYPDYYLLANTGCWICRLDRPWVTAKDGDNYLKAYFNIADGIRWDPKKKLYEADVMSEDWNFSRMIGRLGAKVMCTRRVRLKHVGEMPYINYGAWGNCRTDMEWGPKNDYIPIFEEHPAALAGGGEITMAYWSSPEFPDIDGWMWDNEGRFLAELAKDKYVLEIGCYKGRSTVWMARTAKRVFSVDTFHPHSETESTLAEFHENLLRHGVADKVFVCAMKSDDMLSEILLSNPTAGIRSFDGFQMAFIDGGHDYESCLCDTRQAIKLMCTEGGILVYHDADDLRVYSVINQLVEDLGFEKGPRVNSVQVVHVKCTESKKRYLEVWLQQKKKEEVAA